jgi:hypothetical protein
LRILQVAWKIEKKKVGKIKKTRKNAPFNVERNFESST